MFFAKFFYRSAHIVDFFISHAGVQAYPEGVVHYFFGVGKLTCHTVIDSFGEGVETGVFQDISCKKVARLDIVFFKIFCQIVAAEICFVGQSNEKSEP